MYRCPACGGSGEYYYDDHHPYCDGDNCGDLCPIQGRDMCSVCNGTGSVTEQELIIEVNKWQRTPLEKSLIIEEIREEIESEKE